ncbi:MAG: tetrahydromethanopterin S-methyltransferase subunit G [Methanosarcinales archaeon]|nr:tetrahydromethanopterin S-methyltransferase subunit G [Methanosarcinales archaeon]
MEENNSIPSVVVDQADYNEVMARFDKLDEKLEFVNSEIAQRIGKKVGRDIGILYGVVGGMLIVLIYLIIVLMPAIIQMQPWIQTILLK